MEKRYEKISGENCKSSKLKNADVYEIRRRYDNGDAILDIADDFNISRIQAMRIGKRHSWERLPEECEE